MSYIRPQARTYRKPRKGAKRTRVHRRVTIVPMSLDENLGQISQIFGGFVTFFTEFTKAAEAKMCVCKGECPCHTAGPLGGVPCPPGCRVRKFDGCHRCDPECQGKVQ